MKEHNPDFMREVKPSQTRPERPDNGAKTVKEQGPNSGVWKNNPHKHESLANHAWSMA